MENNRFRIRPFELSSSGDLVGVCKLERRTLGMDEGYSEKYILSLLKQRETGAVVATSLGEVIGWTLFNFSPDRGVEFSRILVDPKFRRRGVGSALLMGWIPAKTELFFFVEESNLDLCLFLKDIGFKATVPLTTRYNAPDLINFYLNTETLH